jgi:hypothetical protein
MADLRIDGVFNRLELKGKPRFGIVFINGRNVPGDLGLGHITVFLG